MTLLRSREREEPAGRVGETLRAARRGMGVSFADAAAQTHLRESYLTALENDDVEALGLDPAYVRGTLRSYADYLGLDATSLVARYGAGSARTAREDESDPHDLPVWHHVMSIVGGVVGLGIIAVVAFAAGGMLAGRSILPGAGGQEGQHESIWVQAPEAPPPLRLEFVEETWVRVTTNDQPATSPPYGGVSRARAGGSEPVGTALSVTASGSDLAGGALTAKASDEQQSVARVGTAESTADRGWYGPIRRDRLRSVNVVCDAAFRCRIDQ